METEEFRSALRELRLTQNAFAEIVDVGVRTVRRWATGGNIPGPTAACLNAWLKLHRCGLAWEPNAIDLFGFGPNDVGIAAARRLLRPNEARSDA